MQNHFLSALVVQTRNCVPHDYCCFLWWFYLKLALLAAVQRCTFGALGDCGFVCKFQLMLAFVAAVQKYMYLSCYH